MFDLSLSLRIKELTLFGGGGTRALALGLNFCDFSPNSPIQLLAKRKLSWVRDRMSTLGPARIDNAFFVSTGLKQHHSPLSWYSQTFKRPGLNRESLSWIYYCTLNLFPPNLEWLFWENRSLWTVWMEKISNLSNESILDGIFLKINKRASPVFIVPKWLIPISSNSSSSSSFSSSLFQLLYVKTLSHKFSISLNICPRNLTINSNLSQRHFGMPNRRHVSLA